MNGNGGRIAVLLVAILAIGILVLPSTVSLFAGQHYWYTINGSGNDIPCIKCHADVFEELEQSDFHTSFDGNADNVSDADCGGCHRADTQINYASGTGNEGYTAGDKAHAASVVACMLCHQHDAANQDPGQNTTPPGYHAGGFINMSDYGSPYVYNTTERTGEYAAHNAFVIEAIEDDTLQDSNEACVACHTHVAVKINWTHARSLEFDVGLGDDVTTDSGVHNWTFTEWSLNGTAHATSWGNTTGYGQAQYWSQWPGNITDSDGNNIYN